MKKASRVLGIVGGSLSFLMALLCVIGGLVFMSADSGFFKEIFSQMYDEMGYSTNFMLSWTADIMGVMLIIFGVLKVVCGVLGLIGGLKVNKNNVTAGVLMIVAAGVSLIMTGGWIATILFTLGGIFALVRERQPVAPPSLPPVQ